MNGNKFQPYIIQHNVLKRRSNAVAPTPELSEESVFLKKEHKIALKDNVKNFLLNSTLHGLKYIGNSDLSKMERYLFGLSFCLAIALSAYYIVEVYGKWSSTPIIIAMSANPTQITDIPFPAITICNMNQARKSRVENLKPGTLDYMLLQSLCVTDSDVEIEYSGKSGTWQYFRQFILNVSQPCDELLVFCRYGSDTFKCNQLFDPILTDEGLCCTFNTVHPYFMYISYNENDGFENLTTQNGYNPVDWSPEKGYAGDLTKPYYPLPGLGTGSHMGLTVLLNASLEEYYCSSSVSAGFKVLLHSPTETPKIADFGLTIAPGKESRINIHPRMHDASPSIRRISVNQRKCLFSSEVKNSFFRTYSSSNCELECESRQMEAQCGCVLYYMPRTSQDSIICGPKDMPCVQQKVLHNSSASLDRRLCDECLPACISIFYEPSVTSTNLLKKDVRMRGKFGNQNKTISTVNLENLAILHFFYVRSTFRASTREEFLGFVDFIANSGGILGLFLGFSILSVIELFYFFSLAPYFAMKNAEDTAELKKVNKSWMVFPKVTKDTLSVNERSTNSSYRSRRITFSRNERSDLKTIAKIKQIKHISAWDSIPYCE